MVGTALAGTDQSPGEVTRDDRTGDRFKMIRGMASREAEIALARARKVEPKNRVAQGISTRVVYLGDAREVIDDLVGGIKSGIANAGAKDIDGLQETVVFERQTIAGVQEGDPHVLSSGRAR